MQTIIEYRNGYVQVIDDGMPCCGVDDEGALDVMCVDGESKCLTDNIPLVLINKITFEND